MKKPILTIFGSGMIHIESYYAPDCAVSLYHRTEDAPVYDETEWERLPEKVKSCYLEDPDTPGEYYFECDLYQPGKLKATISYPLTTPAVFEIEVPDGVYSYDHIIGAVTDKYREIYREESETMTELTEHPRLLNRGESNGKWGIRHHDIGDLVIEGMYLDLETDNLILHIGS